MNANTMIIEVSGKDGEIDVGAFIRIVSGTVFALRNLEQKDIEEETQKTPWKIKNVKMESPLQLTIVNERHSDATVRYIDGIKSLEKSAKIIPRDFTKNTLGIVKRTMSFVNNGIDYVSFRIPEMEAVKLTAKAFANLVLLTEPKVHPYTIETQLEGRLEQINIHGGKHEFCIFDPLTDDKITCVFDEVQPVEIGKLITRRVRVTGEANFNKDHKPTSIKVSKYDALKEQDELPELSDLHKHRINITGGKDSFTFIRDLRDVAYG